LQPRSQQISAKLVSKFVESRLCPKIVTSSTSSPKIFSPDLMLTCRPQDGFNFSFVVVRELVLFPGVLYRLPEHPPTPRRAGEFNRKFLLWPLARSSWSLLCLCRMFAASYQFAFSLNRHSIQLQIHGRLRRDRPEECHQG